MAKHPKSGGLVHSQQFSRRERGTPIQVTARQITLADGSVGTLHAMSLSEAEVPERTYYGNACSVAYERETVRVVFGQPKLGGEGLRSMVMISMAPKAASMFAHSIGDMTKPSLAELMQQENIAAEPLTDFPTQEPEQTAEFIANIVAAAFSGREACLDFYHANAFSHLALPATNRMYLNPIVRIDTRTSLALSLSAAITRLSAQFPADNTPWESIRE